MRRNKAITASIGYIIGGVLIKGIAFITTPIFTRLLTPEEFGFLNKYLSYEAIFAMIIGFQFAASFKSANLEFKNIKDSFIEYTRTILQLIIVHGIILLLVVSVFGGFFSGLTGITTRTLIFLLIINSIGNAVVTVYNSYLSISYSYKKYVVIALINAVTNVGISILLIKTAYSSQPSMGRILGYVIPYSLIALYIIISIFSSRIVSSPSNVYRSFAYRYCTPLLPNGVAEVMLGQFGKLTVDNNLGKAAMGIYSLSYNVYSIIGIVRIALDYVVGPFYFEKRSSGETQQLRRIINSYSRTLAIASIALMLFTPEIVSILGTKSYYDARFTAIPLVCASYYVFLSSVLSQEELYTKKTHLVSLASIITMVVNIILNILIVPKVGEMGAAFVTMGSYLFMIFLHVVIITSILKTKIFDWMPLSLDCIITALMSIVSIIIVDKMLIRYLLLAFAVIIGLVQLYYLMKYMKKER